MNWQRLPGCSSSASWLVVTALVLGLFSAYRVSLHHTAFFTGWSLLLCILFLSLFNLRKRIHGLPLGSASRWLQLHIWVGVLSILLFGLHGGIEVPRSPLLGILFALYVLVTGSGLFGWAVSRIAPSALTRRGETVLFERLPMLRRRAQERAEELVLQSLKQTESQTIAEFYAHRLQRFLAHPRNLALHLVGSARTRERLLADIDVLRRYLGPAELEIMDQMSELVCIKDDLDFQHAQQGLLRLWLFAHVPLTVGLLIFSTLHVVIVYAFIGGMP